MVISFISPYDKKDKNRVEKDRIFFITKSYLTIKLLGLKRLNLPISPKERAFSGSCFYLTVPPT
jgi:hypothetical protein